MTIEDECAEAMKKPLLESPSALEARLHSGTEVPLSPDQIVHDLVMPMIEGTQAAIMILARRLDEMS
jgi:hypothetical protein